jgi:serine/threonine-protein kinase RIO1
MLKGIVEMEEIGIYHADLKINNFIQFKHVFEVIDFDHAVMCTFNKESLRVFERLTKLAI